MTSSKLLAAGVFALAAVASGSVSAKIVNSSYYVPGDTSYQQQAVNPAARADVKAQARIAENTIKQPRTEFGAGSHDTTPSTRVRADVKAEAAGFTKSNAAHAPFSY